MLGYSSDVAWMIEAYVRLAECTGDTAWPSMADSLAGQLLELFRDHESGGLFTTGTDAEELVVRPRELYDNVIPSASSVAAGRPVAPGGTARPGRPRGVGAAGCSPPGAPFTRRAPTAVPALLGAAVLDALGPIEVAVTGDRPDLVREAGRPFIPRRVLAWSDPSAAPSVSLPLLDGREEGFAYVCRFGACRLPSPDCRGASRSAARNCCP